MSNSDIIRHHLDLLPPKTARPFQELIKAGQLPEQAALDILDAGKLSGDTNRLLGFAIAYPHLRAKNVPVHDVIRMAKEQHRTVKLTWSEKRWKAEHERLSRAQTLEKLSGDNISYDLSAYEQHLPERFDGYLIRTSRRLGMEGLRQRHCIASYHTHILTGSIAIAALFVDGKRWTVQLGKTGDPDHPLRIEQIKTRYNGLPSDSVRAQIHATLQIDPPKPVKAQSAAYSGRTYMDTLQRVLPVLRHHEMEKIVVSFEGYGDSGSIESVTYKPDDTNFDPDNIMIEHLQTCRNFDNGQWVTRTETHQSPITRAIEELTYDYLEETGVDWYNNDGGYGSLIIDVQAGSVTMDVSIRYTESQNEYYAERDIATGEEIDIPQNHNI